MKISIPSWNITELTGYEPKTTFWLDFSIADKFGLQAIKDTYRQVMIEWHNDHTFITELAMVINHKCWEHYHRSRKDLKPFLDTDQHRQIGQWYSKTYYELLDWADNNMTEEDLAYFYKTLD